MRLLIDTSAFCKLGVGGLFPHAISLLGVDLSECGRLPALPHMLRRGALRKRYGAVRCDDLIPLAESIPVIAPASAAWLDRFTGVEDIDPGEAQIFAAAAEFGLLVLCDDKRALRALKGVGGALDALAGRIVVLEPMLLALCDRIGVDEVRRCAQSMVDFDMAIKICFSETKDPREGLQSYDRSLATELQPLVLWHA